MGWVGRWRLSGRVHDGGSVATSRTMLDINLKSEKYAIVVYTLDKMDADTPARVNLAVAETVRN